ncbi:MAG: hypothetical protein IID61_11010 [SAR324 cluster bacterium]|nr:hypothetical protein [SAR324 cluster bacterium]
MRHPNRLPDPRLVLISALLLSAWLFPGWLVSCDVGSRYTSGEPQTSRPAPVEAGPPAVPPASGAAEPLAEGTEREVVVVATGDLNGWITRHTLYPKERGRGLAHLARTIARLREAHPGLILLDGGDALIGAPHTALAAPRSSGGSTPPILRLMNRLGYDAAVPGNRDFSLGRAGLEHIAAESAFPWLAANVAAGDAPWLPPYVIIERNGVRVAILGLTTPATLMWTGRDRLGGLHIEAVEASARKWVPILRDKERADLIVALVHSGLDAEYDRAAALQNGLPLPNAAGRLADFVPGLDLVVAAHAHRLSPGANRPGESDYTVPVLEPGSRGNGLAVARFRLTRRAGHWERGDVERYTIRAYPQADPGAMALVRKELDATAGWLDARTAVRIKSVPETRQFHRCSAALVHEAAMEMARNEGMGATPAYSLLPMLWRVHLPDANDVGSTVRRAHLYRWMIYEERPVLASLTGRQMALLLEPFLRYKRRLSQFPGNVLNPGGLTLRHAAKGTEVLRLADAASGEELARHQRYPVWMGDFHWNGGGGIARKALVHPSQQRAALEATLREGVFDLLADPATVLPAHCNAWLEPVR